MSNYIKTAIWILAGITIAAAIAFSRIATWSAGFVLFVGTALVLALWLSAKHLVRTKADAIISGAAGTTIEEINRIVNTIQTTAGNYEADKYRIQQLRQVRRRLRDSDIPRDTTPANS